MVNTDLFFIKLTHLQILVKCANPPVEMLAHMLKVSEGWLPTKLRLIGADRQSKHMPKAQFIFFTFLLSMVHIASHKHFFTSHQSLYFFIFFSSEFYIIYLYYLFYIDICREKMGCIVNGTLTEPSGSDRNRYRTVKMAFIGLLRAGDGIMITSILANA